MISFDEFSRSVKEQLEIMNPEAEVVIRKVNKNNVQKSAISIIDKGDNSVVSVDGTEVVATPAFYLEELYSDDMSSEDITLAAICIHNNNKESKISTAELELVKLIKEFDRAKELLVFQLINTEKNKELLKKIPHRPFLDMSIVYRMVVSIEDNQIASILITNDVLKEWGVTEADLWKTAEENTPKLHPAVCTGMNQLLEMLLDEGEFKKVVKIVGDTAIEDDSMIVVSNIYHNMGAAVILYKDILESIYKMTKHDLYIIMNSVNEFIVFSNGDKKKVDIEDLRTMTKIINSTMLSEEEVLSDEVYHYDGETKELTVVK
ncbi:MAG: hypothetical protein HDR05_12640 [Lachnospiraceae bacterium]|nr:hypothetical protein [Lachnospiraceae bacterium]